MPKAPQQPGRRRTGRGAAPPPTLSDLLRPLSIDPKDLDKTEYAGHWDTPEDTTRRNWRSSTRRVFQHLLQKGVLVNDELLSEATMLALYRVQLNRRWADEINEGFRFAHRRTAQALAKELINEHNYFAMIEWELAEQQCDERRRGIIDNSA